MSSKQLLITSMFLNLGTLGLPVYSYNYESHKELSTKILLESKLKSELPTMGLKTIKDQLTLYSDDDRFTDMTQSVEQWLLHGTKQEDALFSINPARFRNHFYDPIAKIGYSYHGLSGELAPRWALENEGPNQNVHSRRNPFKGNHSFPVNILIPTFFSTSLWRIS